MRHSLSQARLLTVIEDAGYTRPEIDFNGSTYRVFGDTPTKYYNLLGSGPTWQAARRKTLRTLATHKRPA